MPTETVLSRRAFLSAAAIGAVALRAPRLGAAPDHDGVPDEAESGRLLYVGTYTNDGRSAGIYQVRMDAATGALRLVGAAATTTNPSFLATARGGRFVYAVNEVEEFEGAKTGAVSAFSSDAGGALTFLDRVPSSGGAPCYVTADRTGRFLLVANYVGGSVSVLPVTAGGGVGAAVSTVQHEGHGPDADRQAAPHAHCIVPDPANRFALAVDLGLDRVITYAFDARTGKLGAAASTAVLAPGAGPRHLAFHPGGRFAYVDNELDSTVTAFRYDPVRGALAAVQTLPTPGEPAAVRNAPADIHVHPSGRFLYVSNRGHDSISLFAIEGGGARLRRVEAVSTGGKWPRNFALDPSGRFLYVANERSSTVVAFCVNPATGRLTPTGQQLEVPTPVCLRFA